MTKALIAGGGGQLGLELASTAPADTDCESMAREQLDISDARMVADVVGRVRPDLIINAAAYTAVDRAESEPDAARRVNVTGAENLARECASQGIRLVHLSTDFVFDGTSSVPYTPDVPTKPLGVYGQSKQEGEEAVMNANPNAIIIRSGWIYSVFGSNFVKTMLVLMRDKELLNVVSDQVGTPTWARGLASLCWVVAMASNARGIYHWSDEGQCSWYEFAQAIAEDAKSAGLLENPARIEPISAIDYGAPAERPAYSVLDTSMTEEEFSCKRVPWRRQLRSMLASIKDSSYA